MRWILPGAGLVIAVGTAAALFALDSEAGHVAAWVRQSLSALPVWGVLALFAVLPVVGVPVSFFYLLAGARFGIWWGLAVSVVGVAWHLFLIFAVGRGFMRRLSGWATRRIAQNPKAEPPTYRSPHGVFLFTLAPGLPYVVKNAALAAFAVPVGTTLAAAWAGHALSAVPFVLAGAASRSMNPKLFMLAVACLAVLVWTAVRARKILYRSENQVHGR